MEDLGSSMLYWLAVLTFFGASASLGLVLAQKGRVFWDDYEAVFKDAASTNLEDMFLFVDPHQLFVMNMIAAVLLPLFFLMLTGDFVITGVALAVVLCLPFSLYKSMRKKRLAKFEKQLPEALVMVSGSIAAGASLNMALDSLVREQEAPLSQEFTLFMREQRMGVDYDVSLRNMERRIPLQDFQMFTAALRISREVGGDVGDVLSTLADTLRRKAGMEGKIESLTAQGRMQGIVMTGLPIFVGVMLFFMEPEAMSKLFTTGAGYVTVALIVVMEILGYVFIRKVTSIDV